MKLWAIRGAITVPEDTPGAVKEATGLLLQELIRLNSIGGGEIVSIIFTATEDIRSEFPAVAARELGLNDTPLICAREIPKPGALPLCIRVLIHFYTPLAKEELKPVYLREAVKLRPDLAL